MEVSYQKGNSNARLRCAAARATGLLHCPG